MEKYLCNSNNRKYIFGDYDTCSVVLNTEDFNDSIEDFVSAEESGNKNKKSLNPTERYRATEKCPYSELFWSTFSRIRTEYGQLLRISPYSVRMWENTDQTKYEYGLFSRSVQITEEILNGKLYFLYSVFVMWSIEKFK